jgi:CheY-like chemotaxis protein
MADDDAEDCLLVRDALLETRRDFNVRFVRDGEELLDYLYRRGEYGDARTAPSPDLILLDLKMPKMDGRETIGALKCDPRFRRIPVVALTTSTAEDDVAAAYEVGVNSYISKPVTYRALVRIMESLATYWFDVVELPPTDREFPDKDWGIF